MTYMTFSKLYNQQDQVLKKVFENEGVIFPGAQVILAGGTALARFYLQHRASYDLDLFVNARFDPSLMERRLANAGVTLSRIESVTDPLYAAELHGMTDVSGEPIRVSIVEDLYAGMFPVRTVSGVRTEAIEGLYHRKLRTISGSGSISSSTGRTIPVGARQTARDLFDLYVLSKEVKPLMDFVRAIQEKGVAFPDALLVTGLRTIRWMELMDEFEMLQLAERFAGIKAFDVKRYFDGVLR